MKNNKDNVKDLNKDKKSNNLVYKFKRNFMTNDVRTILIILILIGIFLGVNLWVRSLNLAQIDITQNKLYSLTNTSKNAIKYINNDIHIYVWGIEELSTTVDLLKQYNAENKKITYKIITRDNDKDFVEKYYLEDNTPLILIIANEGTKNERTDYVYSTDLKSYDANYNLVDVTEQKVTNSILRVNSDEIPMIYYLSGTGFDNTDISSIKYFKQYVSNFGLYNTNELSVTNAKQFKIPEDASVLVMPSVKSDLNKTVTDKIKSYINKGGNILVLNNSFLKIKEKLPNYQSILDLYGITMPRNYIVEDSKHTMSSTSSYILGTISLTHQITRNLKEEPVLYFPGTIDFDKNKIGKLKVSYEPFLQSSTNAYSKNFETGKVNKDGSYIIGATVTKNVSDGVTSNAVVFSTQASFSDLSATDLGYNNYPLFFFTEELIMNSVAYLANKGEYYSISKLDNSIVTANIVTTDNQDYIIRTIISVIPISIAIIGALVCIYRNKKK